MGANEKHDATYHGARHDPDLNLVRSVYAGASPVPSYDERAEAFDRMIDKVRTEAKQEAADQVIEAINPQLFTKEEIHDLPAESVFEDADGCIFEVIHNGERNSDGTFYREYMMTGDTHAYSIDEIDLPATLLKRAPETPRR